MIWITATVIWIAFLIGTHFRVEKTHRDPHVSPLEVKMFWWVLETLIYSIFWNAYLGLASCS